MKVSAFMWNNKSVTISYSNLVYTLEYDDIKSEHISREACMKALEEKDDRNLLNNLS